MENEASPQSSISPLTQRFAANFSALYRFIFPPKSPHSPSLYSSASSDDHRSTTARSAIAMERRARLVLEYQQLRDPYDRRLGHDLTEEIDLLAQLRLANSELAMQSCFRRLGLSDANSTGPDFSSDGVCNYSPTIVVEQSRYETSNPERVWLPKIRSSGCLRLNRAAATHRRSSRPVSTGTRLLRMPRAQEPAIVQQSDYLPCGKKGQEALEFEACTRGMFKMEAGNKWIETGACPYGDHFQFAHAIAELRPVIRHPGYETEVCRMFLAGYMGPYGHRDQLNRPGGKKEQEALEFESHSQGMFRTEPWSKWKETGTCPYDHHCQFTHGIAGLHAVIRHPHYENCRMFLAGYTGLYGHSNEEELQENEDDSDSDEDYPDEDEDDSDRYRSEDMDYPDEDEYDNEEDNTDYLEEEKEEEKEVAEEENEDQKEEAEEENEDEKEEAEEEGEVRQKKKQKKEGGEEEDEDDKVAIVDKGARVFTIYRIPKPEYEWTHRREQGRAEAQAIASIAIEQLPGYATFAEVVHEEWRKLLHRPAADFFDKDQPWPLFNCIYYTTHGDQADSNVLSWEDFKRSAAVAKMEEEGILVHRMCRPREYFLPGWEYCEKYGVYLNGRGPWERVGKVHLSMLARQSDLARVLHMLYESHAVKPAMEGVKEGTEQICIQDSWPGHRVRLVGQNGATLDYRNMDWPSLCLTLCQIQVEFSVESDESDQDSCVEPDVCRGVAGASG